MNCCVFLSDIWNQPNVGCCWTPSFSRHLNDWEIEIVKWFLSRLQEKVVNGEGKVKVIWLKTKSGSFSVKSLYAFLELGSSAPFLVDVVWNSWVPPKVSFFVWEVLWGKTLTLDQLQRGGLLTNWCFLCHI